MYNTLILFGGNMPDTLNLFKRAEEQIILLVGTIKLKSAIYESAPWGFVAETNFYNMVIEVETELKPDEQLKQLLAIESFLGRERNNSGGYASRGIDLDILFIDDLIIDTKQLTVPHPRLHLRQFTLVPLCEKWGEKIHPSINKTINHLLANCDDKATVEKVDFFVYPL